MTTFGVLIGNVKKDLKATKGRRLSDDDIREAINDAILDYEAERFSFNERSDNPIALVPSTFQYALGETYLNIDEVCLQQTGRDRPLDRVHYRKWKQMRAGSSNVSGDPYCYAVYGGGLSLYPTPNQAGNLLISGIVQLTPNPLSEVTDENAWTKQARRLIRARACWDLSLHRLHNPDVAKVYAAAEQDHVSKLRHATQELLATGQSYVPDWEYA